MSTNQAVAALAVFVLIAPPLTAAEVPDPLAVARRVDAVMAASWQKNSVVPAAVASDADFHRRVFLDLAGRIPTVAEVREFLAGTAADKRAKLVERLLTDDRHHAHFARVWRDILIPFGTRPPEEGAQFEAWLRDRFAENMPYDRLTHTLLAADSKSTVRAESLYMRSLGPDAGNIAASSARVFLGLSLECARCHNHPFANWSRLQFWQLAAVFEDVEPTAFRVAWAPRITIPETNRVVIATLPDGTAVKESPGTPRDQFARWMARPDNKYFAKATVNRLWSQLLGSELVDLSDDFVEAPPHAETLEVLSRAFVQSNFDLRFLIRTITATRAYQFTSARSHPTQDDPRLFARMSIKPLSAEQLADTIIVATGENQQVIRTIVLERFAGSNGEVTILQALWWMNGPVTERTAMFGRTIQGLKGNAKLDTRGKIEELFLATLSRLPTKREVERFVKYVDSSGPNIAKDRALSDVFWVLLNSTEFAVNR